MKRLFAFLRAINVGGHTVKMARLRALFEALGLEDVETHIASGNVVFDSPSEDIGALERQIEAHLQKTLDYEVKTFIRTEAQLAAIARYQPFKDSDLRSANPLNVAFLATPLKANAKKLLMALRTEIDDFHVRGRRSTGSARRSRASQISRMLASKRPSTSEPLFAAQTPSRDSPRNTSGNSATLDIRHPHLEDRCLKVECQMSSVECRTTPLRVPLLE